MDEITRNNSQVHDDSFRFRNWGVGNVVPLQRGKFEGVNAEDWPYTTETLENIYINNVLPRKGKSVGAWKQLC